MPKRKKCIKPMPLWPDLYAKAMLDNTDSSNDPSGSAALDNNESTTTSLESYVAPSIVVKPRKSGFIRAFGAKKTVEPPKEEQVTKKKRNTLTIDKDDTAKRKSMTEGDEVNKLATISTPFRANNKQTLPNWDLSEIINKPLEINGFDGPEKKDDIEIEQQEEVENVEDQHEVEELDVPPKNNLNVLQNITIKKSRNQRGKQSTRSQTNDSLEPPKLVEIDNLNEIITQLKEKRGLEEKFEAFCTTVIKIMSSDNRNSINYRKQYIKSRRLTRSKKRTTVVKHRMSKSLQSALPPNDEINDFAELANELKSESMVVNCHADKSNEAIGKANIQKPREDFESLRREILTEDRGCNTSPVEEAPALQVSKSYNNSSLKAEVSETINISRGRKILENLKNTSLQNITTRNNVMITRKFRNSTERKFENKENLITVAELHNTKSPSRNIDNIQEPQRLDKEMENELKKVLNSTKRTTNSASSPIKTETSFIKPAESVQPLQSLSNNTSQLFVTPVLPPPRGFTNTGKSTIARRRERACKKTPLVESITENNTEVANIKLVDFPIVATPVLTENSSNQRKTRGSIKSKQQPSTSKSLETPIGYDDKKAIIVSQILEDFEHSDVNHNLAENTREQHVSNDIILETSNRCETDALENLTKMQKKISRNTKPATSPDTDEKLSMIVKVNVTNSPKENELFESLRLSSNTLNNIKENTVEEPTISVVRRSTRSKRVIDLINSGTTSTKKRTPPVPKPRTKFLKEQQHVEQSEETRHEIVGKSPETTRNCQQAKRKKTENQESEHNTKVSLPPTSLGVEDDISTYLPTDPELVNPIETIVETVTKPKRGRKKKPKHVTSPKKDLAPPATSRQLRNCRKKPDDDAVFKIPKEVQSNLTKTGPKSMKSLSSKDFMKYLEQVYVGGSKPAVKRHGSTLNPKLVSQTKKQSKTRSNSVRKKSEQVDLPIVEEATVPEPIVEESVSMSIVEDLMPEPLKETIEEVPTAKRGRRKKSKEAQLSLEQLRDQRYDEDIIPVEQDVPIEEVLPEENDKTDGNCLDCSTMSTTMTNDMKAIFDKCKRISHVQNYTKVPTRQALCPECGKRQIGACCILIESFSRGVTNVAWGSIKHGLAWDNMETLELQVLPNARVENNISTVAMSGLVISGKGLIVYNCSVIKLQKMHNFFIYPGLQYSFINNSSKDSLRIHITMFKVNKCPAQLLNAINT